jgi:hypothetical protein
MKRFFASLGVCILVLATVIPIGFVLVQEHIEPCRYYTAPATFESINSKQIKSGRNSSFLWPVASFSYQIFGTTYSSSKMLCQSSPHAATSSMFTRRLIADVESGKSIVVNIPRDDHASGCISLTNDANYRLFADVSAQCHAPKQASKN